MTLVRRLVSIGALLAAVLVAPALAFAQTEAVITGVVTDSSGGVLPGVTVNAVHAALVGHARKRVAARGVDGIDRHARQHAAG